MGKRSIRVVNSDPDLHPISDQAMITESGAGVVDLTATTLPLKCKYIVWTIDGGDARWTWDGSTPSSSAGMLIPDGSAGTWGKDQWLKAKIYLPAGATLNAQMMTY